MVALDAASSFIPFFHAAQKSWASRMTLPLHVQEILALIARLLLRKFYHAKKICNTNIFGMYYRQEISPGVIFVNLSPTTGINNL